MATKKTDDKPEATDEVETHESSLQGKPESITTDDLARSTHPKAPEVPIEVPKPPLADVFDTTEPAPEKLEGDKE